MTIAHISKYTMTGIGEKHNDLNSIFILTCTIFNGIVNVFGKSFTVRNQDSSLIKITTSFGNFPFVTDMHVRNQVVDRFLLG